MSQGDLCCCLAASGPRYSACCFLGQEPPLRHCHASHCAAALCHRHLPPPHPAARTELDALFLTCCCPALSLQPLRPGSSFTLRYNRKAGPVGWVEIPADQVGSSG